MLEDLEDNYIQRESRIQTGQSSFKKMEVTEDCIICSSPLNEQPWTQMSPVCCHARIHLFCLEKTVMLNSRSCPFCRKTFNNDDLNKLSLDIPHEPIEDHLQQDVFEEDVQLLGEAIIAFGDALVDSDAETLVDETDFNQDLQQLGEAILNFGESLVDSEDETVVSETDSNGSFSPPELLSENAQDPS